MSIRRNSLHLITRWGFQGRQRSTNPHVRSVCIIGCIYYTATCFFFVLFHSSRTGQKAQAEILCLLNGPLLQESVRKSPRWHKQKKQKGRGEVKRKSRGKEEGMYALHSHYLNFCLFVFLLVLSLWVQYDFFFSPATKKPSWAFLQHSWVNKSLNYARKNVGRPSHSLRASHL